MNIQFGNRPNRTAPPDDLLDAVRYAILVRKVLDLNRVDHLQMAFLFFCGTYLLSQGVDVSIITYLFEMLLLLKFEVFFFLITNYLILSLLHRNIIDYCLTILHLVIIQEQMVEN